MEEATEYKKYLKALKEATKKKNTSAADYIKRRKQLMGVKTFSCGGMGIAIKGGNFKGVK